MLSQDAFSMTEQSISFENYRFWKKCKLAYLPGSEDTVISKAVPPG